MLRGREGVGGRREGDGRELGCWEGGRVLGREGECWEGEGCWEEEGVEREGGCLGKEGGCWGREGARVLGGRVLGGCWEGWRVLG